jgi:hypothetical protein
MKFQCPMGNTLRYLPALLVLAGLLLFRLPDMKAAEGPEPPHSGLPASSSTLKDLLGSALDSERSNLVEI